MSPHSLSVVAPLSRASRTPFGRARRRQNWGNHLENDAGDEKMWETKREEQCGDTADSEEKKISK